MSDRKPLTERQLDRRLAACPALEAEDIEEAHQGEYVEVISVQHLDVMGRDYDGRPFRAMPGRPCRVTKRKADELLAMTAMLPGKREGDVIVERPRPVPGFESYDAGKHRALVKESAKKAV